MITFTDELLIGNGQIDAEHKMLFDIIENAHTQIANGITSTENVKALIEHLQNYAETHFSHEEKYMQDIQDPEYPIQKYEHDIFRAKVKECSTIILEENEQANELLQELLTYLAHWLYKHILASDTLIGTVPVLNEEEIQNVFEFSAKYHSGIPFVDDEHRILFSLIQRSYEALKCHEYATEIDRIDGVLNVIDELETFTKQHFAHEEAYMKKIKYDGYYDQLRAHEAFLYKMEDVNTEIAQTDPVEYLEDLVEFLLFWLTNHICKADLLIPKVTSALEE